MDDQFLWVILCKGWFSQDVASHGRAYLLFVWGVTPLRCASNGASRGLYFKDVSLPFIMERSWSKVHGHCHARRGRGSSSMEVWCTSILIAFLRLTETTCVVWGLLGCGFVDKRMLHNYVSVILVLWKLISKVCMLFSSSTTCSSHVPPSCKLFQDANISRIFRCTPLPGDALLRAVPALSWPRRCHMVHRYRDHISYSVWV